MNEQKSFIEEIKNKPELRGLDDQIVISSIEDYKKRHKIDLQSLSQKEKKLVLKEIRAELRKLTGQYQVSQKKRLEFLEQNKIRELLETHSSTAERINFYPKLKEILSSLNVNSILDLACGLNPIALSSKEFVYYAADIQKQELELINKFFEKNNILGKVFVYDLRKIDSSLPKADICLLFKVLDIIEKKGHKLATKIIALVPCEKILVSFPTMKLSGKPMSNKRRFWIERMLNASKYNFKVIESSNEIFYLINKTLAKE